MHWTIESELPVQQETAQGGGQNWQLQEGGGAGNCSPGLSHAATAAWSCTKLRGAEGAAQHPENHLSQQHRLACALQSHGKSAGLQT